MTQWFTERYTVLNGELITACPDNYGVVLVCYFTD